MLANGKRIFSILSKIIILGALYKIYTQGNWPSIVKIISLKGLLVLVIAIVVYGLKQLADAWRNKRLANSLSISVPYRQLLRFNLQAVAFDFVLPVPQAEELYRFTKFSSYTTDRMAVLLTVSIKATGLIATIISLMATIVFTSFQIEFLHKMPSSFWFYFAVVDGIIFLSWAGFYVYRRQKKDPVFLNKVKDWIETVRQSFNKHKFSWVEGIMVALLSQVIYATCIYIFALGNNVHIPFFNFYLMVPLVYFGGILPVGIAGLGIKEAVIVLALKQFGVPTDLAWNIGIFHLALMLFYILFGSALFLFDKKQGERKYLPN
jgi:uncharacterized membrane protein YbhN (UPF0104 family)